MDESEVEKIVEKTIKSHENSQIDKIWKNPKKAQSIGLLLFAVALFGWVFVGFDLIIDDVKDSSPLIETLLENMDCQSLKDVMKSNDLQYYQHKNIVQKHLFAECL